MANKKYSSIKNDHCITFDQNSSIVEVNDPHSRITFGPIVEFTTFDDLKSRGNTLFMIDLIGVVTDIQILTQI